MNIVFFGSSDFAVSSLRILVTDGYNISCVVTQPDRKRGRGMHLESTLVKQGALEYGLLIHQPQSINSVDQIKFLKSLNPDLFVVISYGQILSQEVLEVPRILAINTHASILPKYRGAAPINWAIIKGEKATGVTIIKMTEKMDAGTIILQEKVGIEDQDTAITLQRRLSEVAARVLKKTLELIESNNYTSTPQDENKVTFAPKLQKEDGLIIGIPYRSCDGGCTFPVSQYASRSGCNSYINTGKGYGNLGDNADISGLDNGLLV